MPKKLLLAEDSLTIRRVFELALSRSDIAITAVDNGEDAVRLAAETLPDLVVADLTLPGKNGYAVAAELRAMEKTEKIPVLILSGTLVPIDEARFKSSGARGVLLKPFETRELTEKVELLLRETVAVPAPPEPQGAPAADEHWDFSDIMDEVESETGKPAVPASVSREELLSGAILPVGAKLPAAFNEFDVSIDEIEGGAKDASAEPLSTEAEPARRVEHIEGSLAGDAPPPVTDLSPALDGVEEIEEIESLDEVEVPLPPIEPVLTETPASLRVLPAPAARSVVDQSATASPAAAGPVVVESHPPPPAASTAAPADPARPVDDELREFFAGRAGEIFRAVASEAVEKVMWEMTDRLAAEFSAKLRESVESVAWEVIPATAEALIREEIARIRREAGKPSP